MLFLLTGTSQAQGTEKLTYRYFYHLPFQESPYEALTGIHQTTQIKANLRNHYRFGYDTQNRIVELAFMRGGLLVANTTSDNFFVGNARIAIAYTDGKETWAYYNYKNERVKFGPVYAAEYTLDEKGNRISLEFYDEKGEKTENSWGIAKYVWEKLEQNIIKEQRFNSKGEQARIRPRFDFYEVRMEFDKNGFISTLSNYGKTGELTDNNTGVAYDKLTYNSKGDFLGWRVFNKNNQAVVGNYPLTAGGNHYYNEYGDNLKTETFDLEGKLKMATWGNAYDEKTYSADGNVSEYKMFDQNKNMIPLYNSPDAMFVKLEFNEKNLESKVSFMDSNGNYGLEPMHKVSTILTKYDEKYNIIERSYLNKNGMPAESSVHGYAFEKYQYLPNNMIDTLQLDAKGQEIPRQARGLNPKIRVLSYMIGEWERTTYFPDGAGGWTNPTVGSSETKAVMNGTFLDETITNPPLEGINQISRNTLGVNPETGLFRLMRINGNSLGTISVFDGKLENSKLILDNVKDTPESLPAFRFTYTPTDDFNRIELIVERSADTGKTWTPILKIASMRKGI
jgi:hypothetical protein